ncbi:MAG: M28 family peptidase [Candidatus Marinimicrobia bacterium]|nr:M28 family peptidase [Candidatus Neomarinimicrobiota bacterium]MCF7829090.1 M28 family peptidase [Candidatus Neomarinimicrobiota bacterium]MCF7881511.1 M28 family peptidase [Candidatus Neomarinimicrobiota bacterium]
MRKLIFLTAIGFFLTGALVCAETPVPEFNEQQAWDYLLAQTDLGPRAPGTDGHYLARDFFVSTLNKFTDRVREQQFIHTFPYEESRYDFTNIIAEFGPASGKRILLGAHWDTRPWADMERDPSKRNQAILGANDGASGVAVLLEFARIFRDHPPPVPVTIVLFDAEDMGKSGYLGEYAVGSRYFAENLENPDEYRYGIVLDMIGDANLHLPMERYSRKFAPDLTRRIWDTADSLGYTAFRNRIGVSIQDDHLMLIRHAGIPSVDIIDFNYPDESHRFWHTLQDTPDKCSPRSLKVVGETVLHVIYNEQPE